ncbi:MAG TPA: hypothetical protein VJG32_06645 [Anaerolineae bacterium]|nr:hypothetical protein [Anaerolineae bacterium]
MRYRDRPGCLEGLLRLFLIRTAYNWGQRTIGTGRGGCAGFGCGAILFVIFVCLVISTVCGTDWFRLWVVGVFSGG